MNSSSWNDSHLKGGCNDFAEWREIPSEALARKELRNALVSALNSLPESIAP